MAYEQHCPNRGFPSGGKIQSNFFFGGGAILYIVGLGHMAALPALHNFVTFSVILASHPCLKF